MVPQLVYRQSVQTTDNLSNVHYDTLTITMSP